MRLSFAFLTCLLMVPGVSQGQTGSVFVTPRWVADRLNDPDLVILHVAFNRREYQMEHIPGARFLWYSWLAPSTPDEGTVMPPIADADTLFEGFGITERSMIVLCFTGGNLSTTTRMYLALSYFGLGDQTRILDGGLPAWKRENLPLTTEAPFVQRTSLDLNLRPTVIRDADWVREHVNDPGVAIVDARTRNFYEGTGGGILRQGHIKGAISMPFNSLLDSTSSLLGRDRLQAVFDSLGIRKGTTVVSYCHVGQQATVVYAVARMLGFDAVVYDGSFEDWNVRGEEYPVTRRKPESE